MRRRVTLLIILILIAATAAGALWYARTQPGAWPLPLFAGQLAPTTTPAEIIASGTMEADAVAVTSEIGGRLAMLQVREGDEVSAGQVLAQLDTSLLDCEISKAEAALAVARAGVDLAKAGARPEAIVQAEALLAQAQVAARGLEQAWQDAKAVRDAPQELDVQIAAARNQAAQAEVRLRAAELMARAADMELAMYGRLEDSLRGGVEVEIPTPGGPRKVTVPVGPANMAAVSTQLNLAGQRTWQAHAAVEEARAARDAAYRALDSLQKERGQPLTLDAQVHAAEAAYREAEAAVEVARKAVDDLKAGARPEDIAVAQAAVGEAEAALQALEVQRNKMTLRAPLAGLIVERSVSAGEVIGAGQALLKIANLERVTLTVYVSESQIGRVKVGQTARVRVDSFPDLVFTGTVSHIATQAEFTPKNVQTKEERATMVFAVKVDLPNPEHRLKPGMPADATIETR